MDKKVDSSRGYKAPKVRSELGHSGPVEMVEPFKFEGKVKELPKDYRGTTPKAFGYEY